MKYIYKCFDKLKFPVLIVLCLLAIQAQCDLALPDYMSDIVNIGIEQDGVEYNTPEKIRKEEFEYLQMFMTDEQKAAVVPQYREKDGLMIISDSSDKNLKKLSDNFVNAQIAVIVLRSGKDEISEKLSKIIPGFDGKSDPVKFIYSLPEQLQKKIAEEFSKEASKYDSLGIIAEQTAIKYVIDEYKALGTDMHKLQMNYIFFSGGKMLLFSLLLTAAAVLVSYFASKIAAHFGANLRLMLFKKVLTFSGAEFNKFSEASLITRCTNDVMQIQFLIAMLIRVALYAPILGLGAVGKISGSGMTWIIWTAIGAILCIIIFLLTVALPKFNLLQKLFDKLNSVSREMLVGVSVVRAFGREKYEEEKFAKSNEKLTKTDAFVNRIMTCMMPLMMLIMNCISMLIVWVGADHIDKGTLQVGDMIAFTQYSMMIIMAFLMISMTSVMIPRAAVAVKRCIGVLKTESSIKDPDVPESFDESTRGIVEFRDVSFAYPGAKNNTLENISFKTAPGQTTAIVGATGSGKSTLINLIMRFFDVTKGSICVDGKDIRNVKIKDLRNKIGAVPQKGMLFSGTIKSNIAFSDKSASDERIQKAAKVAAAEEFISEKEDGFDSKISQGGTNVSGGQRQRLAIARAVIRDPEIYIFDDSFSALDYATDAKLRAALKEVSSSAAVITVAQRISTVINADNIIVLDKGKIVGQGTHSHLMESCEVYRQTALSQMSDKEAAL